MIAPDAAADDYAVINQGQLKNIARAACDELNANLPGGAGEVINDLISSWQVPVAQTEDFAVVTQGQLKALAAPFYERLTAAGLADGLPWASATTPPENYAPANIGQAKQLFSFELPPPGGGGYGSGSSNLPLTLTVLSGSNQVVTAGASASGPLVVRATRAGLPWAGVVVTFQASGGNLGGSGTPSATVTTSTSGDAAVSYAAPSSSASTQTISASAESATATLSVNVLPQGGGGGTTGGGGGGGDLPPPEQQTGFKLFTAWRYKEVNYRGGEEAVYPTTPIEGGPGGYGWMKSADPPPPPDNDGFNGDADEQGDLNDPGDPRDDFPTSPPQMVSAEEGDEGAVYQELPGYTSGGDLTGEPPTAEASSNYTAQNSYNPPESLTSTDPWALSTALSLLADVHYYKGADSNGWMGNGYRGLETYQVYSMLHTSTVVHDYTYTDEFGDQQQGSLTVQQTTAHVGEGQLRLQCNQARTPQDEPLTATFMLLKETKTIASTSATTEFQAAIQLKIVTGITSTEHMVTSGQMPDGDDVTVASGVITVRAPAPVDGKILRYYLVPIEFITPAGDPVNAPVDAGTTPASIPDGANEFTFSAATSGVLTMKLKAKVPGVGSMPVAEQAKFTFEVDTIGNSTFAWDAANPGGKATASGDFITATATYTGLPQNNTDFGLKKARVKHSGNNAGEAKFEVFFPRDATNHPGNGAGTDPNWFFYWMKTVQLLGPSPTIVFKTTGGNLYDGNVNEVHIVDSPITIHSYDAPHGTHNPLKGIDCFAWVMIHETQHYKDWCDYWDIENQGIAKWQAAYHKDGADQNKDDDYLPNRVEDVNLNKLFDSGDLYDWAATLTPGAPSNILNDAEDYTCKRHKDANGHHSKDWANPGMQHKTLDKYDD